MKEHIIAVISLFLEMLAFFVTNEALQWIFAFSGLIGAFVAFKKEMPDAYLSAKEAVRQVFSLYKWKNLRSLAFDQSEGTSYKLSLISLLACLLLCILVMIVKIANYFLR